MPVPINKLVLALAVILDGAIERGLIPRNPARAHESVPGRAARRTHLDSAEQIAALLDAAGMLDREPPATKRHLHRRARIATLVYSCVRIGELVELRWRDVDLAAGRFTGGSSSG